MRARDAVTASYLLMFNSGILSQCTLNTEDSQWFPKVGKICFRLVVSLRNRCYLFFLNEDSKFSCLVRSGPLFTDPIFTLRIECRH